MFNEPTQLTIFQIRPGEKPQAIETYYVLGRKPNGWVARVVVPEDLNLQACDVLIFDFITERVE